MRKKLNFVAILLAICFFCQSCAVRNHYEVRHDLSIYFQNANAVISTIRGAMRGRSPKITVRYQSHSNNMEELELIMQELIEYALSETDSPQEGDYLRFQYGGYTLKYHYQKEYNNYHYEIEIQPKYYTSAEQEETVSREVADVIASLDLPKFADDVTKIQAVYNYVLAHVQYDVIHAKNQNYHLKSTAYGALHNGRATCQGYAVLLYRLLRELHVDVRILTGTADNGNGEEFHAWNLVQIGEKYYHLDATWDSQHRTKDCFLKATINLKNHIPDEKLLSDYAISEIDYPLS